MNLKCQFCPVNVVRNLRLALNQSSRVGGLLEQRWKVGQARLLREPQKRSNCSISCRTTPNIFLDPSSARFFLDTQ